MRGVKYLNHLFEGILTVAAIVLVVSASIRGIRIWLANKQSISTTSKKKNSITSDDKDFLNLVCALAEVIKGTKP